MKDLFSDNSSDYKKFRPNYPPELYERIFERVVSFNNSLDVATGNGQVAIELSEKFKNVFAIDISKNQLESAYQKENIYYSMQKAEATNLPNKFFDLITIAQAFHWLDHNAFFSEVRRISSLNCLLACWCYNKPKANFQVIQDFYDELETYWEPERKFIDNMYEGIEIPIESKLDFTFENTILWTREHFLGYLSTWSSVKKYIDINKSSPFDKFDFSDLSSELEITFPIYLKTGFVV